MCRYKLTKSLNIEENSLYLLCAFTSDGHFWKYMTTRHCQTKPRTESKGEKERQKAENRRKKGDQTAQLLKPLWIELKRWGGNNVILTSGWSEEEQEEKAKAENKPQSRPILTWEAERKREGEKGREGEGEGEKINKRRKSEWSLAQFSSGGL